jgi:hypothetical protein
MVEMMVVEVWRQVKFPGLTGLTGFRVWCEFNG